MRFQGLIPTPCHQRSGFEQGVLAGAPGSRVQRACCLHNSIWHVPIHSDAFWPRWNSSHLSMADGPCAEGGPKVYRSTSRWHIHLQQLFRRPCGACLSGPHQMCFRSPQGALEVEPSGHPGVPSAHHQVKGKMFGGERRLIQTPTSINNTVIVSMVIISIKAYDFTL